MAVSTRGFRSILSRSRRSTKKKTNKSLYSNLPEDSGATTPTTSTTTISTTTTTATTTTTTKKKKKTTAMVSERRPISVNVTVLTSTSTGTTTASNELECANGVPTDSNDSSTRAQDTEQAPKPSHDHDSNIFEATRNAAILMVQNASSMTDMMAKTLASKSITATTPPVSQETPPRVKKLEEEKIEVEMDDTDFEKQLHKTVEEACRWGNALVETSKERVHNAVSKTHEAASDLVEESLSLSEQAMVSTEESSVAAFQGGLALSPVLEHTSERLELLYESAIAEVQEFLLEHWAILKDYIVAHYYYDTTTTKATTTTTTTTTPQKPPVAARDDDAVLHVAIEVRMTSRE